MTSAPVEPDVQEDALSFSQAMYVGAKYTLTFLRTGDRLEIDAAEGEYVWQIDDAQRAQIIELLTHG